MKKNSKELIRFEKIFISTALEKAKFAELFGFTHSMINRYLDGTADLQKISRRLANMGYSSDWLYTGKGKMHNNLVEVFDPALENELNIDEMNNRINEWIKKCFIDIEDFESMSGVYYTLICDCKANSKLITYDIIKKLKSIGLNYEWAITGNGSIFQENRGGKKLKNRYLNVIKKGKS